MEQAQYDHARKQDGTESYLKENARPGAAHALFRRKRTFDNLGKCVMKE